MMIVGGIGVTPLLSLPAAYVDTGRSVAFSYSARSERDMVYADSLRELAASHSNLRLVLKAGSRLSEDEVAASMASGAAYLIAGPYPMQRAWRSLLPGRGVSADDLYYEPFSM